MQKRNRTASSMETTLTSQQTQTSAGRSVQLFQGDSPFIPLFHMHPPMMTCPGCKQGRSRTPASSHAVWNSEGHDTHQRQSLACLCAVRLFILICPVSVDTGATGATPLRGNAVSRDASAKGWAARPSPPQLSQGGEWGLAGALANPGSSPHKPASSSPTASKQPALQTLTSAGKQGSSRY